MRGQFLATFLYFLLLRDYGLSLLFPFPLAEPLASSQGSTCHNFLSTQVPEANPHLGTFFFFFVTNSHNSSELILLPSSPLLSAITPEKGKPEVL